jgi:hypothetical protein
MNHIIYIIKTIPTAHNEAVEFVKMTHNRKKKIDKTR